LPRQVSAAPLFASFIVLVLFIPLLSGCEFDVNPMDIRTLAERSSSNDALACPAGICAVPADFDSPAFAVPVEQLLTIAESVIGAEPRTKIVAKDMDMPQIVFVQRSRILQFPDTVWVQGVKSGTGSSVIIFSRSNYGDLDLGVNRRRVRDWLGKLTQRIETAGPGN
jgi:uncharacterized protein (DUF1499 family)